GVGCGGADLVGTTVPVGPRGWTDRSVDCSVGGRRPGWLADSVRPLPRTDDVDRYPDQRLSRLVRSPVVFRIGSAAGTDLRPGGSAADQRLLAAGVGALLVDSGASASRTAGPDAAHLAIALGSLSLGNGGRSGPGHCRGRSGFDRRRLLQSNPAAGDGSAAW